MASDSESTVSRYRREAAGYDASARRTMALRQRTIDRLGLRPGDSVLDVGCGTGLSLPLIRVRIGTRGRLMGVDVSPDMLKIARDRVAEAGWDNVTLFESAVEGLHPPFEVTAILINYAHDVMRSRAALAAIFARARPGARVAAAGIKHPPRWLDPFRLYRRFKSRACFGTREGLETPWDLLAGFVPDLQVESTLFGTGYIAWGTFGRRE
jgi:demethylmenaquinone methyltransferase/2-methoxy-6-polyprenyl-1,4-benzoquinol methylase